MSKHLKAGSPDAIQPPDDLERNPGINESKGTTMAGIDPEIIEADSTVEGDVANGTNPQGGIERTDAGRTNK